LPLDPPSADKQPFDKLRVTGKSSERCGQHSAFSSFKGKAPSWFDIPSRKLSGVIGITMTPTADPPSAGRQPFDKLRVTGKKFGAVSSQRSAPIRKKVKAPSILLQQAGSSSR